jgi:hypothetical protein
MCIFQDEVHGNIFEQIEKDYLDKVGETGKGTYYKLKGQ